MPEIDLDFLDPRISMNYWWPRIADLDINSPDTVLVPLEDVRGGDDVTLQPIIDACDALDADQYFLRGDKKAARVLEEGSFLSGTDDAAVEFTLENLLMSVLMSDIPTNSIAVREYLDVDEWAHCYGKPVAPEARVFIDEGDVRCHHCRVDESDISPHSLDDMGYDSPADVIDAMERLIDEDWEEKIRPQAQVVAAEFEESSWSVDFLRTESGEWVQTDMALYGIYYNELSGNGWTSLSAHDPDCEHNLEENPPDTLPENPENALTERSIQLNR